MNIFLRLRRHVFRPDDTVGETHRKWMVLMVSGWCLIAAVAILILAQAESDSVRWGRGPTHHMVAYVASWLTMLSGTVGLATVIIRGRVGRAFIFALLCAMGLSILMFDLHNRSSGVDPAWPLIVVFVDLQLVSGIPGRWSIGYVSVVVVWLLAVAFEDWLRYGLYDAPGTAPQSVRSAVMCGCETLPCAYDTTTSVGTSALTLAVFLLDFHYTRGFAVAVRAEKANVASAVETAREVAAALGHFDLPAVAAMLDAREEQLPADLHTAFWTLLRNLECYRPYLPLSLLEDCGPPADTPSSARAAQPAVAGGEVPPPGLGKENVAAVAFTDVKGSTALWDAAPEAMSRALRIHNAAIRLLLHERGGYEVKTIGDAFMVAFARVEDALDFSLDLQTRLLASPWPPALLRLRQCAAASNDAGGALWGGLTLRIGVHSGAVAPETNPVTGRTDYFGPTPNLASRLEGCCPPGCVAVTRAVFAACEGAVGVHAVRSLGCPSLAGFAARPEVVALAPRGLARRLDGPPPQQQQRSDSVSTAGGSAGTTAAMTALTGDGGKSRGSGSLLSLDSNLDHAARFACALDRAGLATTAAVRVEAPAAAMVSGEAPAGGGDAPAGAGRLNALLAHAIVSAERTDGKAFSLVGTTLLAAWNALRPCPGHREKALQFATLLTRHARTVDSVHAGLVTGPVTAGCLGSSAQRFVTVAGLPTALSLVLAREARDCSAPCLQACVLGGVFAHPVLTATMTSGTAASGYRHRPVEVWRVTGSGVREEVTVFEPLLDCGGAGGLHVFGNYPSAESCSDDTNSGTEGGGGGGGGGVAGDDLDAVSYEGGSSMVLSELSSKGSLAMLRSRGGGEEWSHTEEFEAAFKAGRVGDVEKRAEMQGLGKEERLFLRGVVAALRGGPRAVSV